MGNPVLRNHVLKGYRARLLEVISVRSYQRQLFRNGIILQCIVLLLYLTVCFFAAFLGVVEHIASSNASRLDAVARHADEVRENAESAVRTLAKNTYTQSLIAEFMNATTITEKASRLKSIQSTLIKCQYNNPELMYVRTVTPDGIISDVAYDQDADASRRRGNNAMIESSLAKESYQRYLESIGVLNTQQGIVFDSFSPHTFICALINERALYQNEYGDALYIYDQQGNIVHRTTDDKDTAFILELFNRQDFGTDKRGWSVLSSVRFIDGRPYFPVEYINARTGMRYMLMLELIPLMRTLLSDLTDLFIFYAVLAFLVLCAVYRLVRHVLRPFHMLKAYIDAYGSDEDARLFPVLIQKLKSTRSLQYRIFALYSMTLIPILALLPYTMERFTASALNPVQHAFEDTVKQSARNISYRIDQYRRINGQLVFDEDFRNLFSEWQKADSEKTYAWLLAQNHSFVSGVRSAAIYDAEGQLLISTAGYETPSDLDTKVLRAASVNYTFAQMRMDSFDSGDFSMIYTLRSLSPAQERALFSQIGYFQLEMDDPIVQDIDTNEDAYWYMYDNETWKLIGTPSYTPLRNLVEGIAQSGQIDARAAFDIRWFTINEQILKEQEYLPMSLSANPGNELLLVACRVDGTNWSLLKLVTRQTLYASTQNLPLYALLSTLITLLIILLITMLFSVRIMRILRDVEQYFTNATNDRHALPISLRQVNEVSALAHAFHDALGRISALTESVGEQRALSERMESRKRLAEAIALQSQMDSHLISNVFASMKILLKNKDLDMLSHVITATYNFLRSGLVHGEYDTTVRSEIAHVEAYLDIERIRFQDRLLVDCAIEPEIMDCMVPKYLLQPILENAIVHGMPPGRPLHIELSAAMKDGGLWIEVRNDGVGIDEDTVHRLNSSSADIEAVERIGLCNVQERILLRHGPLYGLRILSEVGGQTVVSITLPIIRREIQGG